MYTILVGGPGVGKGQAILPAVEAIDASGTANLLSDRLTMSYVLEKLSKGFPSQVVSTPGSVMIGTDSSALIVADELKVFVDTGDDVLTNMTALWDSREHPYGYGTRGKGTFNISKPGISFLAGSTPRWLAAAIPLAAVGGGFTRRVNFVYEKPHPKTIPFPSRNHSALRDSLVHDLQYISTNLQGDYTLSKEVGGDNGPFATYYKSCVVGELEDEATATYKDSGWVHALKLAMVLQACDNDSHEISMKNWSCAVNAVTLVVSDIQTVFRGVGMSDLTVAADRVIATLETHGIATRKQIQAMCWQYVMENDLEVILRTLVQGGMVMEFSQGKELVYQLVPKGGTP